MEARPDPAPFPATLRRLRRQTGVSQLALAERSGTTQRYVSFLETGRSAPGRDVVLRLADALGLPALDRQALLTAAGFVLEGAAHAEAADMAPLRATVREVLRQQNPFPAVLLDPAQTVLDMNRSFEILVDKARAALPSARGSAGETNLLRLLLRADGFFPAIERPGEFIATVLGRVLREAQGDARALAVVNEVLEYPHVRRVAGEVSAAPRALAANVFPEWYAFGGHRFGLVCLVTSLGAPGSAAAAGLRLELFHPVDASSATTIRALVGATGGRVDALAAAV